MIVNESIEFEFGQIVYHRADIDQLPMIVIGVLFTADGGYVYQLSAVDGKSLMFELELSAERDIILTSTN